MANVVESIVAFNANIKVYIVTRSDWRTEHYDELMSRFEKNVEIVTFDSDLDGAWIKTLSIREWSKVLEVIHRLLQRIAPFAVIFMALDDYLVPFIFRVFRAKQILGTLKVFTIKYRVQYLLKRTPKYSHPRNVLLRLFTLFSLRMVRSELICFDERFDSNIFKRTKIHVIPDPWFGDFSKTYREIARTNLSICSSDFVLATIGRQDRRKGFPLLLENLHILLAQPSFKLLVVGAIATEFKEKFEELKILGGNRIVHIDRFVSDSELKQYFSAADLYLLAYSLDFTSSSGTLVRAAASGVPLLACSHGLVGHRVSSNHIGVCFDVTNNDSMVAALNSFRSSSDISNQNVKSNLANFADKNSISKFSESVSSAIFNARR